jgi:Rieske 2Fe-2S family protein
MERTLERARYLSPDAFAEEKEGIFCRQWMCVGREEEVPDPGDYLLLDSVGESVVLVRTREGRLVAHYNVCRHRGSQLVLGVEPKPLREQELAVSGRFAGGIKCPYHAWTYALDGRLRTAPYLDEDDGLHKDHLGLHPVAVDTWGGFVFLHLGAAPADADQEARPPLAVQLGAAPERVRRYPLAELRIARRITYRVMANWKVIVENYNECYHCGPVHPELCRVVPAFKDKGGRQLDWDRGVPHREGAWTFTLSGTSARRPFAGLDQDERVRHKGELIYPNLLCSLSADHVAAFTLWPHEAGRTTVICDFLFHPSEMASAGFDPMDAVAFWDLTNRQDWVICESVQRGMASRVFTHGYYAPMEYLSQDIRRYVAEHVGERLRRP